MTLLGRLSVHHGFQGFIQGLFVSIGSLFLLEKGLALWQVGVAFGVFGITAAILELPLGALADIRGRIQVYRWSRYATAIAFLIATFSHSIWLLFVCMSLLGFARSLETGSISAWQVEQITDQLSDKKMGQYLGQFQSVNSAMIALGALTGGYLPTLLNNLTSLTTPTANNLLLIVALTLVHIGLLPWLFKEGDRHVEHKIKPTLHQQISVAVNQGLNNIHLQPLLLVAFVFGLVLSSIEAYWQPWVKNLLNNPNYTVFGWLASAYFLAAASGPAIYTLLIDKLKTTPEKNISGLLGLSGLALYFLTQQQSLSGFTVCYLVFIGLFVTLNVPLEQLMNQHTDNSVRSSMHSVFSLVTQLGLAISAFGLAPIVHGWGISILWKGLAICCALVALWRTVQIAAKKDIIEEKNLN